MVILVILFSLLWLGFGMGYTLLDDDELKEWRKSLENIANRSYSDSQLIDWLVTVHREPISSPKYAKAISDIFEKLKPDLSFSNHNDPVDGIIWLSEKVHNFDPAKISTKIKVVCLRTRLCCWMNTNFKHIREKRERNANKIENNEKVSLDSPSGKFLYLPYKSSESTSEIEQNSFGKILFDYLIEDKDNKLKNHKYEKLNYLIIAQRLYKGLLSSEGTQETILEKIAKDFGIVDSTLKTEFSRNFKPFVAGLALDIAIANKQNLSRLVRAVNQGSTILEKTVVRGYPECTVQELAKEYLSNPPNSHTDCEAMAKRWQDRGIDIRTANSVEVFKRWQEDAKPVIGRLILKQKPNIEDLSCVIDEVECCKYLRECCINELKQKISSLIGLDNEIFTRLCTDCNAYSLTKYLIRQVEELEKKDGNRQNPLLGRGFESRYLRSKYSTSVFQKFTDDLLGKYRLTLPEKGTQEMKKEIADFWWQRAYPAVDKSVVKLGIFGSFGL